jgi:hypothetical protein
MPQKLLRRSMLVERDLRFPEEKVRLEDGMMLARAYYSAARVSALGDYDYYYIRRRDDGQNISSSRLDPVGYTWSIGEVSRLVKELDPDPDRADRIILDLYRRKCLKMYGPERFAKMPDKRRDRWLREHAKHIATYIPPELEAELKPPFRQRSERARAGDKQGLLTLGKIEQGQTVPTLIRAHWSPQSLHLDLHIELQQTDDGPGQLFLELKDRDADHVVEVPITDLRPASGDERGFNHVLPGLTTVFTCSATVSRSDLKRQEPTVVDLYVRRVLEDGSSVSTRIQHTEVTKLPRLGRRIRLYKTIKDNVSIKVRP